MSLEKLAQTLAQYADNLFQASAMTLLGVMFSLGRDMQKVKPDPARVIIGRAITTGILALAAGSMLAIIPGLPFLALLGMAAGLASLGVGFLERALFEWLGRK